MKKINLIERLWTDSHEKQKPQRFVRYAAMLIMLLTLGVGQMWADTNISYSGGYIYFADTHGVHQGSTQLCGRKSNCSNGDWYTAVTNLTNISNTKLYYTSSLEGSGWSNVCWAGWALISNSSGKSNSSTEYWSGSNSTWYSSFNSYGFNSGSVYLITVASSSKGASTTTSYKSSGITALNSTQTAKYATRTGGGTYSAMSSGTTPAKITMSSYKFVSGTYNSVSSVSPTAMSAGGSTYSTDFTAAYTAKTIVTVSNVADGWEFDGWYSAATGGSLLESNKSYTYYPTAATTVYARFTKVTYSLAGESWTNSSAITWTAASTQKLATSDGVTYSVTMSGEAASAKQFKLLKNESWDGAIAYDTDGVTKICYNGTLADAGAGQNHNFTLTPYLAGDVTVSYNTSSKTLTITCEAPLITFNKASGSGGSDNQKTYSGKETSNISTPSRSGYAFQGYWSDDATPIQVINSSGAWIANKTGYTQNTSPVKWATGLNSNHTFTAHWNANDYTITLDNQSATTAGTTKVTATFDASTNLTSAITKPTKTGYIFGGYFTGTGGSGTQIIGADGNFIASAGGGSTYTDANKKWKYADNITLKAYWIAITVSATISPSTGATGATKDFTFSITSNVGTGDGYDVAVYSFGTVNSGEPNTASYLNSTVSYNASPKSYTASSIGGFSTAGNYTTKAVVLKGGTVQATSVAITYSAGDYYTVSFNMQGHGSDIASQNILSGSTATEPSPAPTATGYTFGGWYQEPACTNAYNFSTSVTANKNLYAKWTANNYTVTFNKQSGSGGDNSVSATYDADMPSATMPTRTGYTFGGYYTEVSGGGTKYYNANGTSARTWNIDDDTDLYAQWTERTVTVSPTNSYDAGDPEYSNPTVTNSGTIGITSTSTLTAQAAGTGYTFAGWTLSDNIYVVSGTPATDREITIRHKTGDGTAVTATAKYNEVLTSDWHIVGTPTSVFHGSSAWGADGDNMLRKASGSSTADAGSVTINVTALGASASSYQFKVHNSSTTVMYGWSNSNYYYMNAGATKTTNVYSADSHPLYFIPDALGNYVFSVDWSGTYPSLTVTWPTSYAIQFAKGTVNGSTGNITAKYNTVAFNSNTKIQSGQTITLIAPDEKEGYTWAGWFNNNAGSGVALSTDKTYTPTVSAATTYYACYTEDMHDVTVNVTGSGTVSYGTGAAGSSCTASAGIATVSNTIHAIPAAGYAFVGWTNVDEEHHITGFTATWNNTNEGWDLTVKADAATTIVANFAPRFALVGAISAAGDPDGGMPTPTWDANSAAAFTYSAGTYTLTRGLTSPNTTYAFQIIDRRAESWIWRGYSDASNNLPVDNTTTYTLNGGNNVYFDTRAAGDYTFTVVEEIIDDVKYPKVKIACPTSYLITSGQKTFYNDDASSDATETGGTFTAEDNSSNNVKGANKYVAANASVTFTATPKDGYTFAGWYEDASCETEYDDDDSDVSISGDDGEVLELSSITAEKTVYAKFAEKMTTVTLFSIGSGHIEISSEEVTSTKVGKHTTYSVVAVPDDGHYFTGWTKSSGTDYTVSSLSTATTTLSGNGGGSTSGQMLTANFARRWVIAGEWEKDGSGNWVLTNDMNVSTVGGKTCAGRQITGLAANTSYNFKLYDRTDANGGGHWVGYASSGQVYDYETHDAVSPADSILVNSYPGNNISLKTAAQGDYYFYYNIYSHKLYVSFPASRKVEMGIYTQSDGVSSAYVGGTISAVDERDNVITNGLYIKNGDDITFTASPKAGYIWRGWYDNAYGYGDPVATERVHTDENVTSVAFRRYAFFEEALYTVKVNRNDVIETSYKVGIDTHPTIMAATAPTGKIFDRWVTTGSATVEDPYASTTKITGATDDVSTVTATFKDLPKIYIDMTSATGWTPSNMYVVFYKNGGYFDGTNGTGLSSTYVITPTPLEMTRMGTSKIWYYSYDPTSGVFEGETITCVAFVDHTFDANTGNFSYATVTYRTDFSSCMNMFVVTDDSGTNKNTTCYYRNTNAIDGTKGYWRKYEENNSGFYLNNLPGGSVEFTNEDGGNTYSARVNLDANTTYYFYLGCCNGWNWSNNNTTKAFNSDNRTRMVEPYNDVSSDGLRCKLTTTAAGYYTFSLTPQNTREVQLSIDFPVAANDYRAVYNNAASSPTISRPSNIIKSDQNSGTISLWLNKGTNYISFQKASLGDGGAVTWSACGVQQTVSDVPDAGIYTMTLTKSNTTYTVSTPVKYDGDLFIRTDCAPGKWADYTENKLEKNTFNFKANDASTFDYYYCKWINDAGTNVRCVIANEINVALSDTLKGESILVSVAQPSNETLPEGANVRFSYNSQYNTLTRSYLTGASTDVFLNIIPDAASKVYKTDGTTDMYGSAAAKNKFSDLGNWVYELDVKVKPGATAAVKANYNSTSQELIAAGSTLLGGTEDKLYQIRLLYDFRTNYLMSAWMPSGDVSEAIELNSDIMIVRRGQNDANQLSFSGEGELTEVKRAYGVFEFNKDEMVGYMNSWSDGGTTYGLCMYYFSLPFDVNVSDIFGVGTMGDDWRIQFYNGKKRAEKGWFAGDGTTTFWEDVPADTVLYAYEGYLLMLNRSHFNNGSHKVWNNVTTSAYLYFPSTEPVYALDSIEKPITVPSHECTIDRFFTQDSLTYYNRETKTWGKGARNHKYVDSHWNMMGTPLFRNKAAKSLTECTVKIGEADSTLNYVYEWVPSTNSLSARQVLNTSFTFKPMFAYMVQYSGTVTFEGAAIKPAAIAAHRTSEHKQYTVELELTKENQFAGRTYIELRENAVDSFLLNEDMYMMKGSKVGDIYTHAGGYEVAANVLTVNSHVVPVSVDTKSAGTYTFSMPSNFSGTVTLVDKFANTRTNLGVEDYEIYLEKGTISDRFEIEININNVPTAIDGVSGGSLKDGKVHKFIMNDQMYILKDGVLYDARGNRVK